MRKAFTSLLAVCVLLCAGSLWAQATRATAQNVPELPYELVPNFLRLPPGFQFGEAMGVAVNSKGHVFVYDRSSYTRLTEWDRNGNYVREIGQGFHGFEFAHSVRVDAEDNIWVVDEGTNMVIKFSPVGKVLMVLGRRPEPIEGMVATNGRPNPPDEKYLFRRPTDVAWDPQGNIFVSDGYTNHRVVKYDKDGRFLKSIGSNNSGKGEGQFNLQNELYVGELMNWRVQKLTLHPK
jgi:hypothetical protein